MCRRCSYDVCFDCGMHDNCLIDRSKDSQKTLRSVFKEYAIGHHRNVAISTSYDIISPSDGHMRRHQHKRGLGVGEDCRYAVFSDATMNVDTYHLPTPSERPDKRDVQPSSNPTIALAQAVVKRCMQLVDVVAAEVAAGFDCLDHEWVPKRPLSSTQPSKSGFLTRQPRHGMILSQAQRRFFVLSQGLLQWQKDDSKGSEVLGALRIGSTTSISLEEDLRIQTCDSQVILTCPEGGSLREWAEALRKEAEGPPAEEQVFAIHPSLSRFKDLNSSTCLDSEPSLLAWLLEGEDAPRGYTAATIALYANKIDTLIRAAIELQKSQYYTDLPVYRAVPDFLVQFGVSGDDRNWKYEAIEDDDSRGVPFLEGMVCLAASSQNSRMATLCIFLTDFPQLGKKSWETPFARVSEESLPVLRSIYTGYGDMPQCGGSGPDPIQLQDRGNSYIKESFPKCDYVESAEWVS